MRQWKRRLLAAFLAMTMALTLVPGAYAAEAGEEDQGLTWKQVDNSAVTADLGREEYVEPEEAPMYADDEQVRVSIVLEDQPALALFSLDNEMAQAMDYREQLEEIQADVAEYISEEALDGQPLDVVWNLTLAANIISANVEYGQIEAIEEVPGVTDVVVETRYEIQGFPVADDPNMHVSSGMTATDQAWTEGYTGAGMRIAIIDTGLDIEHQSFNNDAFLHALEEDAAYDGVSVGSYDLLDTAEISGVLSSLNAAKKMPSVTAAGVYHNEKLPYCFNYVDSNLDVTHVNDTQGEHGSHVAGISAANRYLKRGDSYVSAMEEVKMTGNAPDAQVLVMKVFGANGGAYPSDYMVAIEDAVLLGCDTVNLSLGSGNPGRGRAEALYRDIMENLIVNSDTVVAFSAGNSYSWPENSSNATGTPYSDDVAFQTTGEPGSYTNSLSVASVDNNGSVSSAGLIAYDRALGYTESSPNAGQALLSSLDTNSGAGREYDFVYINAYGKPGDFDKVDVSGKIALCNRGEGVSFTDKGNRAAQAGAVAVLICNNAEGTINMSRDGYTATIPYVSITLADALFLKENAEKHTTSDGAFDYYTGKLTIKNSFTVVPGTADYETMSDFSSWGVPGNLSMKPEITAPGGNIWSLNGMHNTSGGIVGGHNTYESMSGTSMASPQMAGIGALVKQYIEKNNLSANTDITDRALANSLMMSTATPLKDEYGNYYSILKQGSGLANTQAAINADSYILMGADATAAYADGKVKVELGDDPDRIGRYDFSFTINNLKDVPLTYTLGVEAFTQEPFSYNGATYVDQYTTPLNAELTWDSKASVSGAGGSMYDFDGNGTVDLRDGDALLDYVTGVRTSLYHQDKAYYGLDSITSYNGYRFLQEMSDDTVTVPANGSVTINATLRLDESEMLQLMEYCPNGAYVEAYVKVDTVATSEGALGTSHTIPVLGYYGNWTDASMFDKGSRVEYRYGLETRTPYLGNQNANSLVIQFAGESDLYYYGGNTYATDAQYLPQRNALNNQIGDKLARWSYTAIRNAAAYRFMVQDVNTGEVYVQTENSSGVSAAYYYVNGQSWRNTGYNLNLNWSGTDASGNPLPEDTTVELSLTLAPELYVNADGSVNWNALGKGASQKMQLTIDNTAPEIQSVDYDSASKTLTVSAIDNQYVAAFLLFNGDGTAVIDRGSPNQTEKGVTATYMLDLAGVFGKSFLVAVVDYAGNMATYEFEYTIKPDVDGHYFGFNSTNSKWVAYSEDGSESVVVGSGSNVKGGTYAHGYVYYYDNKCNFYAVDASEPMLLEGTTWIGQSEKMHYYQTLWGIQIEYTGEVYDMAYDKQTETMYAVYQLPGVNPPLNIGTVDLLTGEITKIAQPAFPQGVYALAVTEDGTFYALIKDKRDSTASNLNAVNKLARIAINGVDDVTIEEIGLIDAPAYRPSLAWDSYKNELVLSAKDGIYTVDLETAELTPVSGTVTVSSLFVKPAEGDGQVPVAEATSITLDSSSESILKGSSVQLSAEIAPWNLTDKSITWTSSDPSVATVNANGLVTGVGGGTATITATSNATPSVYDTCEVEVSEVKKALKAVIWNTDSEPWWSSFNTSELPNYTPLVKSEINLNAATLADDGYIYGAGSGDSSVVYKIDSTTLKATENLGTFADGIAPVSDLLYTTTNNELYFVFGWKWITDINGSGWNMSQSNIWPSCGDFIAMASLGLDEDGDEAIIILDDTGKLWQAWLNGTTSISFSRQYIDTGIATSSTTMNSLVYAYDEDGVPYLFWSRYNNGDTSELIAIDINSGNLNIANLGDFGYDVWPVVGLTAGEIPALPDIASKAYHGDDIMETGAAESLFAPVENVPVEEEEPVEDTSLPEDLDAPEDTDLPDNTDVPEDTDIPEDTDVPENDPETPAPDDETPEVPAPGDDEDPDGAETLTQTLLSAASGPVTVRVTANELSTSGVIEVKYDPDELELVRVNGMATLNSANTANAQSKGEVIIAYAYKDEVMAGTTVAQLTFNCRATHDTSVILRTTELGSTTGSTATNFLREIPISVDSPAPSGGGNVGGSAGSSGRPSTPDVPTDPDTPDPGTPNIPSTPSTPAANQFVDLTAGAWYSEYVDYVVSNGLMQGTSATEFSPNGSLSRAMLVTILHRAAGQASVSGNSPFSDVASGKWYTNGVIWASLNGLVTGYSDGTFLPNGDISRQELAVILWRYAQLIGLDVSADGTTIPDFADRGDIASWAAEAISWAYRCGILTGDNGRLNPTKGATRIEAATMLTRFLRLAENAKPTV